MLTDGFFIGLQNRMWKVILQRKNKTNPIYYFLCIGSGSLFDNAYSIQTDLNAVSSFLFRHMYMYVGMYVCM